MNAISKMASVARVAGHENKSLAGAAWARKRDRRSWSSYERTS